MEKDIEKHLRIEVKRHGGMALKFVSPGTSGVPDRIVLLPGGRMFFAELKAPGRKPRPLQMKMHRELRQLGFIVLVIDGKEQIDEIFTA
ncbi:MAG: VRR-NUC domain-containing protein [Mailhella sp.]|nr:VRR-NUC domain-containing protein [Mailhella sp.]